MALNRRQFLLGAAGAAAAGAAGLTVAKHPWAASGGAQAAGHTPGSTAAGSTAAGKAGAGAAGDGILVVTTLYGGNDGLNTLIPYQAGQYLGGRPDLGYQPQEVIPLTDGLALHPNLKGLKGLWDAKTLAIVRGVGYPNPNRSHFRSMDIWQSAVPDTTEVTGWLGRWLDGTGDDPLRAISVGNTLPKLLSGGRTAGSSVPVGNISLPGGAAIATGFAALSTPTADGSGLGNRIAQTGADLLKVNKSISDMLASLPADAPSAGAAGDGAPAATAPAGQAAAGSLASQLDLVAKLVKAGSPTRVYSVSLGGFDTHANEKDTHARLMGELDAAITGFFKALGSAPQASKVVLMTYSEFGRRVAANASGGTDHGTAGPMFVVGPRVKGGAFYGDEPSMTDLDAGDLKFTTDFRSVYATMLGQVIGVDPKQALGKAFTPLPFL